MRTLRSPSVMYSANVVESVERNQTFFEIIRNSPNEAWLTNETAELTKESVYFQLEIELNLLQNNFETVYLLCTNVDE